MAEVREAVDTFVDLYNDQWLPEKNGFISPSATREAWYARQAEGVAAQDRVVSRYPTGGRVCLDSMIWFLGDEPLVRQPSVLFVV